MPIGMTGLAGVWTLVLHGVSGRFPDVVGSIVAERVKRVGCEVLLRGVSGHQKNDQNGHQPNDVRGHGVLPQADQE
jgi:hypothetical protein